MNILSAFINIFAPILLKSRGWSVMVNKSKILSLFNIRISSPQYYLCFDKVTLKYFALNLISRCVTIKLDIDGLSLHKNSRIVIDSNCARVTLKYTFRHNLYVYTYIPDLSDISIRITTGDLCIKTVVGRDNLANVTPAHPIFHDYIRLLPSQDVILLIYFDRKQTTLYPRIKYNIAGLTESANTKLKDIFIKILSDRQHLAQSYISTPNIPTSVKNAIIHCEDPAFLLHNGFCPFALGLILNNILDLKMPHGGGSTITQQLIKNTFYAEDNSFKRKLGEILTAYITEHCFKLSKDDIIEVYINMVEMGIGVYGFHSASKYYFDKEWESLNIVEILTLTYILPRPRFFEEALRLKTPQLRHNLKLHILKNMASMQKKGLIDNILQYLPLTDIVFSNQFGPIYFDSPKPLEAVKYIIIHCSATEPKYDLTADDIRIMHLSKGYDEIGYHWIIRYDGVIERGRSESYQGAHCKGYNHNSIGICYIGGIDEYGYSMNTLSGEQDKALFKLCKSLLKKFPDSTIIGHNQVCNKDCPSFNVIDWYHSHCI